MALATDTIGRKTSTVASIPTITAQSAIPTTTVQSAIPTTASTSSGTNTAAGSFWYSLAEQQAEYNGTMAYNYYLEQGVNARYAQELADREKDRSLQRSIATGYIDGNPTLDRQVAEWNRQNQLWNQGYQEQSLGLDYAKTLASLTGPRDWKTYSNLLRNTANTELPGYMKALQSGSTLAGFQNTTGTTNGTNSYQNQTVLPGQEQANAATYTPPWQRDYSGTSSGTSMDYATAVAQARQQLAALGGNQWLNATDAQIVAEIQNNASLFVNSPIRTAILAGNTNSGSPNMWATGSTSNNANSVSTNNASNANAAWIQAAQQYLNQQQAQTQGGQVGVTGWPVGQQQNAGNGDYLVQGGPYNTGSTTPSWLSGTTSPQYPLSGVPTQQANQGSNGNPYAFNLSATQVRPDQWNNMTDSEKEMLAGDIENSGGNFNDWQQMMQKAWNTGKARGTSTYGF